MLFQAKNHNLISKTPFYNIEIRGREFCTEKNQNYLKK